VTAPAPGRLRFRFTKHGKIRFTSHRDVARAWERALRRSGLPVAWSEGFSPHPLLSFGLALPTGSESLGEYLDVRLVAGVPPGSPPGPAHPETAGQLVDLLDPLLPGGLDVVAAAAVPDGTGSLQQEVTSCSWELEVLGVTTEELAERIERLLDAPTLVVERERKGRAVADDVRPAILELALHTEVPGPMPPVGGACRARAELATHPRGVRPGELLVGLGEGLTLARSCRTHQWIERDGSRVEPLTTDGVVPRAAHAEVRAP
jgi:radical SAM-linked protein